MTNGTLITSICEANLKRDAAELLQHRCSKAALMPIDAGFFFVACGSLQDIAKLVQQKLSEQDGEP